MDFWRKLLHYLFVDCVGVIKDLATPDDLSSLSDDIDELLRAPGGMVHGRYLGYHSTLATSLNSPPPRSRPVYLVNKKTWLSGRHIHWLCTLLQFRGRCTQNDRMMDRTMVDFPLQETATAGVESPRNCPQLHY
eukprot:scaffold15299_cov23-Cyclotella_meneghiniana.AAC.5